MSMVFYVLQFNTIFQHPIQTEFISKCENQLQFFAEYLSMKSQVSVFIFQLQYCYSQCHDPTSYFGPPQLQPAPDQHSLWRLTVPQFKPQFLPHMSFPNSCSLIIPSSYTIQLHLLNALLSKLTQALSRVCTGSCVEFTVALKEAWDLRFSAVFL